MDIIINDLSSLNPSPNQFVAIDLEIFTRPGEEKQLHRPHVGKFACLSVCYDPNTVLVYTSSDYVAPVLDRLQPCVWVMQNGKFDITHLRRWAEVKPRRKYYDTMFIERILFNGYYDSFSLKSLARRYLHFEMPKEARETFTGASSLTREQIEYAANDASITLQVAMIQKKLLNEDDRRVWSEIDCPALWAFLDFRGFAIDVEKWNALAEHNKQRQSEMDSSTIPFNPRSSSQVVAWLSSHGFKGIPNSRKETLESYIEKYPNSEAANAARIILESRMYGKMSSTYGKSFIERYIEYDNEIAVVHANYDINKAETGRTSASDPPMQQIPIRKTREYRYCFIARPGNKLIIADYSAQEPRLTAVITGDEHLIEIFRSGKDVYIEAAREVFEKEVSKGSVERSRMKSIILGIDYGMSEFGLSARENIEVSEARRLINKTLSVFPGVKNWMETQKKKRKFVNTPFGRKIWLNPYSNQVERNALNAPIQGGAADMMKKALASIHQNWPFDCPFGVVGYIHDELVLDVPAEIAGEVAKFVKEQMETTATNMVNGQIPFIAEVSIGDNWGAK